MNVQDLIKGKNYLLTKDMGEFFATEQVIFVKKSGSDDMGIVTLTFGEKRGFFGAKGRSFTVNEYFNGKVECLS